MSDTSTDCSGNCLLLVERDSQNRYFVFKTAVAELVRWPDGPLDYRCSAQIPGLIDQLYEPLLA